MDSNDKFVSLFCECFASEHKSFSQLQYFQDINPQQQKHSDLMHISVTKCIFTETLLTIRCQWNQDPWSDRHSIICTPQLCLCCYPAMFFFRRKLKIEFLELSLPRLLEFSIKVKFPTILFIPFTSLNLNPHRHNI